MSLITRAELRQFKLRNPKTEPAPASKPLAELDLKPNANLIDDMDLKESLVDLSLWQLSQYEGLYTYHDGTKRWFHCISCQYYSDRLYHSKMHYQRIHINGGKAMEKKRKFIQLGDEDQAPPPKPPSKVSKTTQPRS